MVKGQLMNSKHLQFLSLWHLPWRWLVISLCWLAWGSIAWAQAVQPVPALSGRVIDQTATLAAAEQEALRIKLEALETSNGAQVVVFLVPTTAPEDIAAYANRVADTWKIGRKDVGDGLLVVVAINDRKLRIEVSRALEGAVPDLAAKRIIDQSIAPHFKKGDFAAGLNAGVDALIGLIRAEGLPSPAKGAKGEALVDILGDLITANFVLYALMAKFMGLSALGLGFFSMAMGTVLAAVVWIITSNAQWALWSGLAAIPLSVIGLISVGISPPKWAKSAGHRGGWSSGRGGGSSGWGGGGGFSSGGGGSFGGGGASGGW
jgi:uncharacterized protein